jgi:1-phosphofructokinase
MARILTLTLNPALDLTVRLPQLEPGEVNRSESVLSQPAGKGVNVAQVLADLGHSPTVAGFLGADNAPPFEALFRRRGFIDAFVRVPGETRSNIKLAEGTGRITDINGPGPLVGEAQQAALMDRLDLIAADFEIAVVAGSLPRGVDPQWLRELLLRLQGHGLKVAFDCSGAALRAGIEAAPWLIKPNDQELGEACGQLAGSVDELAAQVDSLRSRGVEQVVVSQGADGVRWFGPQGIWRAVPPRVDVASTVGAGDSLLAGMVHGLLCGWPPERTLRQATAVAALAVTQFEFGIGDAQRLRRIEDAVQVEELAASQA